MRVAVFSTKSYDRLFLEKAEGSEKHEWNFFEARLHETTAPLAAGMQAVCVFVNDRLPEEVLTVLAQGGTRLIALRCAGYNNVDLKAAARLGLTVARVPAYSPHAVAEHTLGLILTLNRKIHRAYNRVREGNFAIDGLMGFDLYGKTAGVVGLGKIGSLVAGLLRGFGCRVLALDPHPVAPELQQRGIEKVSPEQLLAESDLITLHCPLTPETHHIVNARTLSLVKPGVMLINTSRGALIDTSALIASLKSGCVGSVGLDVYEEEAEVFFEDHSGHVLQDDVLARLLTFPNVLITSHQAFFTQEAMAAIAQTTLDNLNDFERNGIPELRVVKK